MTVMERVVPYDLLHSEEAFYWSSVCRSVPLCVCVCVGVDGVCCCRYLHNMGDKGSELMEKILPTLSNFCIYVQEYVTITHTNTTRCSLQVY